MAARPSTHRLFVALFPDSQVQGLLAQEARELGLSPGLPVPLEHIHLTVLFLGPVPAARLEAAWVSVEAAAKGVGPVDLADLVWALSPTPESARLLALASPHCPPNLAELNRRLALRLAAQGKRGQAFWPHLTLWRFPGPQSVGLPGSTPGITRLCLTDLALVESRLTNAGASHRRIATLSLAPSER
jgi:2'-5' RNA ligase